MNSDVPIDATGFPPYFEHVLLRRKGVKEASTEKDYTPRSGDRVRNELTSPDDGHEKNAH
jgi:hypothetical protein